VDYDPDTRVFLPLAFLASAFFALDALAREELARRRPCLVALGGARRAIAYAVEAGAEYYGVGLACAGLAYGFEGACGRHLAGRAAKPAAAAAVTLGWLPFEELTNTTCASGGVHSPPPCCIPGPRSWTAVS
jgi:hypothetical protein